MGMNQILEEYGFTSRYEPPEPDKPKTLDALLEVLEQKFEVDKLESEAENE